MIRYLKKLKRKALFVGVLILKTVLRVYCTFHKLAQYTNETRELHKIVGESITSYLSELIHEATGVDKVEFDPAQSKFPSSTFNSRTNKSEGTKPTPR